MPASPILMQGNEAVAEGAIAAGAPLDFDREVRAMDLAEEAGSALVGARDSGIAQLVAVVHVFRAQLDADAAGLAEREVQRDLGSGRFAGRGLLLRGHDHHRHPSTIGRSMPLSRALSMASG